jgi:hypothetical protein
MRNAHKVLDRNLKVRNNLRDLRGARRITLSRIVEKQGMGCGLDSTD